MKILFVNDDGYDAVGINALYREFAPHCASSMCAPLLHKSAFSHAINFQGNLEVVKLEGDVKGFALDGTPADCSKAGLHHLFKEEAPFDFVLSGINFGLNVGRDIFYSGTVGAARESVFLGVPAIAFSQEVNESPHWDAASVFKTSASHARQIFEALPKEVFSFPEVIINVNFPLTEKVKGIKMSFPGSQSYNFNTKDIEIEGTRYITFKETEPVFDKLEGSDFYWVKRGYVAISALYKGVLVHEEAQKIASILEKLTLH